MIIITSASNNNDLIFLFLDCTTTRAYAFVYVFFKSSANLLFITFSRIPVRARAAKTTNRYLWRRHKRKTLIFNRSSTLILPHSDFYHSRGTCGFPRTQSCVPRGKPAVKFFPLTKHVIVECERVPGWGLETKRTERFERWAKMFFFSLVSVNIIYVSVVRGI